MKRHVVIALERLCGFLDRLPPANRQYGCEMGLSGLAVRLDERWKTKFWAEHTG